MNPQITTSLLASLWAGVVLGISFVAQPAKFGSVGLSRPTALSVGRRIFRALHGVELCLGLIVVAIALYSQGRHLYLLFACAGIWLAQVLILMPRLSKRVDAVLAGNAIQASPDHMYFAALELLKICLLMLYAFSFAIV